MSCYITQTGSFLPGKKVTNDEIDQYLGVVEGEEFLRQTVLKMNKIKGRHYALDRKQNETHDVYNLASQAISNCLSQRGKLRNPVSLVAAGTTYAPLAGPGMSSILHDRLRKLELLEHAVEISSHAGICTASAAALITAVRSVRNGEHLAAVSVGSELPSCTLKSTAYNGVDDRGEHKDVRTSQWFMSTFLRFMLSDGAGAFLLESAPKENGISFEVNWTFSRSYAHETPRCMTVENRRGLISQDVSVLSEYILPMTNKFFGDALARNGERLDSYKIVLPHISSFFFLRHTKRVLKNHSHGAEPVPFWTNLEEAGNTGSASIYIMLDQFVRDQEINNGDRILLFVPESGQFNFAMFSLTAVVG